MLKILLGAAIAATSAPPANYQINLEIARTDGDMRHVSAFEMQVAFRDGPMVLSMAPDGADPVMLGDFKIDDTTGEIFAKLEICRPDTDPCDALATPSLSFQLGEPARIKMNHDEWSIDLVLDPIVD